METKKRGWVKNAAIIFLSAMLVLTFFSNTILNWSLPEVSGTYAGYGTLSTSIRGSGTVESNMGYSVRINETRKIKSVLVRNGDRVEAGQTLFELDASDSTELKTALATLEEMELNYSLKLLDIVSPDYAENNENISELKAQIERTEAKLEKLKASAAYYDDINDAVDELTEEIKGLEGEIEDINERISEAAEDAASMSATVASKLKTLETAKEDLKNIEKQLKYINEQISNYSDSMTVSSEAAKEAYETAKKAYDEAEAEYEKAKKAYEANLAALGSRDVVALKAAYDTALAELNTQDAIVSECEAKIALLEDTVTALENAVRADPANEESYKEQIAAATSELNERTAMLAKAKAEITSKDLVNKCEKAKTEYESAKALSDEKTALDALKTDRDEKKTAMNSAAATYSAAAGQTTTLKSLETYKKTLEQYKERAEEEKTSAEEALDAAVSAFTKELTSEKKELQLSLKEKNAELETLNSISELEESKKSLEKSLSAAVTALAKQQATDEKTQQKTEMDLKKDKDAIDEQKALVEKLRGNDAGEKITATYSGTITGISLIAGDTANSGEQLAKIDVEGKGYTMKISVTNQQAQKVKVGDSAKVVDYWWGNVKLLLTDIKNDTSNPGKSKILEFSVEGDVSEGQNLTISIGDSSTSYSSVIPTSAIREDKDGKFILTTTSKSTPIGNRYYAKRVDVTVIASDSVNSAIDTGDDYFYEFVITNSTSPIEDGTQIRLAAGGS